MKIAILSDSTADLPKELREKHDIHMIPLSVVFDNVSYREEIELSTEEFYKKVKASEALPTTSQPSAGAFLEMYKTLAKDYDAIVSIHISSKLSGTIQAAESAKEMAEGIDISIFDSKYAAIPQGFFVLEAAKLAKEGKSATEIIDHLETTRSNIRAYFMVDSLSHLQRGGRIGGAQALVGSLLKVKPILHVEDGLVVPFEKIRTTKRAIGRILSMLEEDIKQGNVERVAFLHADDEQIAIQLRDDFVKKHPTIETMVHYFGAVIGTHIGEGSIGITWQLK